ncbi:histidinol-phosphate aminotransferase [Rhodoferax ferrireducens]|uniref:histidinol-phosphate transaminase n=1 Tax=Rhodoferax ferrireducens TaxID=192843 RepID=A0ABU2C5T4_9BURK|nr:aminotransferase class I/II-fold pyridoxal phosphate-dependent enzyme [Rhodoferax ferrireducens]MDR7376692.1 histidinol-phosphate aminotransferase [Rhodoferax ferrireducens]
MTHIPVHGGPDALGVPRFDFSTNSNACGPCPYALAAVQQADATRYPDPQYTAMKQQLAAFHGVAAQRIVLAASASEFIHRISAVHQRQRVYLPQHHYGDYLQAAQAWSLALSDAAQAQLLWACEPSSPLGQAHAGLPVLVDGLRADQQLVLDCAYAPLRLEGRASLDAAQRDRVWQMWTPNKALGLTGIRAAYAIAPLGADTAALQALCPSWPVGAHGVALLQAWCVSASQQWLAQSLVRLREWKARQLAVCKALGWECLPSDANFFCARPGGDDLPLRLQQLRACGIKLRDATSFGLPGYVRLGVLPPLAQDALVSAS